MPQQIFQLSVLSDDFCPSQHLNKDMSLQGLYNWRELEMTELAGTLWAGYYAVIAEVNALLARIDAVVTLDETEKLEKMRIVCEAKALKSWCYFDLLRLFAPRYEGNENNIYRVTLYIPAIVGTRNGCYKNRSSDGICQGGLFRSFVYRLLT